MMCKGWVFVQSIKAQLLKNQHYKNQCEALKEKDSRFSRESDE